MLYLNRRVSLVAILATSTTSSTGSDFNVLQLEIDGGRFYWVEHRYRDGARVDSFGLVCGAYALPPMPTSLILEEGLTAAPGGF